MPNDAGHGEMRVDNGYRFRPGELVCGRFHIIRFISRGGMGELYQAEDLELHEVVALKTIRPEIAADDRVNQRFRREVQLARKITHPNICRIFDLFQHEPAAGDGEVSTPIVFVTMELLEGETLAELLKREGRLTVEQALPVASQMAGALAAAHAAGIVHRDFKSNNVMILKAERPGGPPRVVVTDFGIAYKLSDTTHGAGASLSVAGEIMGTPDYMAPEQIQGGAITPATDIYALGMRW
jgi:eukaryotic-like serine/threonine-protein kinase